MKSREPEASALSRWTSRLAFFCVLLIVATFFLHRLFGMPTPVAANVVAIALAGAAIAVVLGVLAAVRMWRDGGDGAARIVTGLFVALLLLSGPLVLMAWGGNYPAIYDVTTDLASPPPFTVLAQERSPLDNRADYPGAAAGELQARAYPDLKPMQLNRSQAEAFDLVVDALKREGLSIARQQAPDENGTPGYIEAVDRTLVLGLYGDVAVRVAGGADSARVDLRSASRYGSRDFGSNAVRLRTIMRQVVARMEETIPTADGERPERSKRKDKLKPGKADNPKNSRARRPQRPVQ